MHSTGIPKNKVTRFHIWLHPLAAAVLEPLKLLICPVEEIPLDPATVGLSFVTTKGKKTQCFIAVSSPECVP